MNEIQEVYRLQGVNIDDKHLEVISRQMTRWVKIEDIGDSEFLPEEDVVEEEPIQDNDLTIDALAGYDEETRALYSGGLSDDPGPELVMPEVE